MNIAQVGLYPIFPDYIKGGVEASVYGLTHELCRQGHTVHAFDFPRTGLSDRIETAKQKGLLTIRRYQNYGTHNVDMLKRAKKMVADILDVNPDVVHIHGTGELSSLIFNTLKCSHPNLTLLLTIHGLARVEKRKQIAQALDKREWKHLPKLLIQYWRQNRIECNLLEKAESAIVDTEYLVEALRSYPVNKLPKLHVIPQGIDESYNNILLQNTQENRILCVGAFGSRKSQIEVVRTFEILRNSGVNAKLVFCGIVAEEIYYKKLMDIIKVCVYREDIEVKVNVTFDDLKTEYSNAKIFVLHSKEESQGIVLAEAMACGLPVVSTNVGGIPYVVDNGKTGLLCNYGEVGQMANNIRELLKDNKLWMRFSMASKSKAGNYNWRIITNQILEIYKNL